MNQSHIYGFPNPMPCVDGQPILPCLEMKRKMMLVYIWLNSIYMYVDWVLSFLRIVSWRCLWIPFKTKLEYGMKCCHQEACVLLKIFIENFLDIMGSLILHHHCFKTIVIFGKFSFNISKVLKKSKENRERRN